MRLYIYYISPFCSLTGQTLSYVNAKQKQASEEQHEQEDRLLKSVDKQKMREAEMTGNV